MRRRSGPRLPPSRRPTGSGLRAVSLFSNCGAGDTGYAAAGFGFEVMAELDPRRLEVALLNHPGAEGVAGDLRTTWRKVVRAYRRRAGGEAPALLAACPPCQGMSSAQSQRGSSVDPDAGSRDERNLLVVVIANVARALKPRAIVVENVEAFLTRHVRHPETGRAVSAAALLIERLEKEYAVFPFLADLADFGVPQTRKRAFLTFVRRGEAGLAALESEHRAPYPRPTHSDLGERRRLTLAAALAEVPTPKLDPRSKVTAGAGLSSVPVWSSHRYAMVAAIPAGSAGSAWENDACGSCGPVSVGRDDAACPSCGAALLRPVVANARGRLRLIRGFRATSYRRMDGRAPAPTITTASGHLGSDTTIHPTENRLLTPAECARLQTFPETFQWGNAVEQWGTTNVRAMIGEAVPPLFTRLHGLALRGVLTGRWKLAAVSMADIRCTRAKAKVSANGADALEASPAHRRGA